MRNDNQRRGPYSDEQYNRNPRGGYGVQPDSPEWKGGGYRERSQSRGPSPLFEDRQERMNQFERSSYGHNERHGDYGRDSQYGGRDYGSDQFGEGADYSRGQSYPGLRSRSADPGQSSYGGFTNEDTRYQRQQLGDQSRNQGRAGRPRTMPKGYKRSDERLREDLCEQLSHSGLDVSEVSVEVSGGKVTLEGNVENRRTKHAIEDMAADCMGVQEVDNRVRVEHHSGDNHQSGMGGSGTQQTGASRPATKSAGRSKT